MTFPQPFAAVVGQERAVSQLRAAIRAPVHAYLLVGPGGTGHRELATSLAAGLLCEEGGCGRCEQCRRAFAGTHPDVIVRERTGPFITVDDAREIGRLASLSPVEARRKVLVLVDFHLVRDAAPALLKAIEEPPATTVFVVLADQVPPELVTIASRCVRVELSPLPTARIVEALVDEGVEAAVAEEAAAASNGRLDRARLLASDEGLAARRAAWRDAPLRLDGTGAAVAALAEELMASGETVLRPLEQRQAAELAEAEERARLYGERGSARRELEARHRREQRRLRTDELRFGLATLASPYRERLAGGRDSQACLEALDAIAAANEALARNPNETLLLQALLVRLSRTGLP
ncbi:MAG TPA: hypothetical protein VK988_07775 [Acidimicrobiales bacterium]|nr:hypothetical protein [Acidimicrobiales bacterium]